MSVSVAVSVIMSVFMFISGSIFMVMDTDGGNTVLSRPQFDSGSIINSYNYGNKILCTTFYKL
jgi:hypothetical protein